MKLFILLIQLSILSVQALPAWNFPRIISSSRSTAEKDILKNKQMAAYFQAASSSSKAPVSQLDLVTESMTGAAIQSARESSKAPVSAVSMMNLLTDSMATSGSKKVSSGITPTDVSLQKDINPSANNLGEGNLHQNRVKWSPKLQSIVEESN